MNDDLFAMTTDINGKPIPRWQERLEQLYTDYVPFGEILSLVRCLIDDRAIEHILNTPDDVILADFKSRGGDIDQFAAEMRQKFDVIARLTRENADLLAACEAAWRDQRITNRTNEMLRAAIAKARGRETHDRS